MKDIRYVLLNPTGNLTCLVLDPVAKWERKDVTAYLMNRCEQVGYLMASEKPGALARLQMMGGEFCGNASMATAAFLARENGLGEGEETVITLEVSGMGNLLPCSVRHVHDGWRGTIDMPLIRTVEEIRIDEEKLIAVTLPGMIHLIMEGTETERKRAEILIRKAAGIIQAPAIGLLQWEEKTQTMIPLIYVRESGTLVWETACGSGSTAIAGWKALQTGESKQMSVSQPGGILTVDVEMKDKTFQTIRLTGNIQIGETERI